MPSKSESKLTKFLLVLIYASLLAASEGSQSWHTGSRKVSGSDDRLQFVSGVAAALQLPVPIWDMIVICSRSKGYVRPSTQYLKIEEPFRRNWSFPASYHEEMS
ncbi:hypothetical protein H6P81_005122 [Aristolochia fimbriata]|uniref:Uncharacterized protein n=1 Tax=Aristolochia fimbriata TaxID=158543 RepID=A0AAV7EU35_ARIFI|nr:hypothetical protein H6P81_005122 [Aristolochia fimbriata]